MKPVVILAIALSVAGCAAEQQASRNKQANEALNRVSAHCDSLMADPVLDPIRSKVALKGQPTFEMLANEDRASDSERPTIREWANRSIECQQETQKVHQQYGTPMHVAIFNSAIDSANALRVQLHNGQLTYGQYNRERQKLKSDYDSAWAKLNAELARQNAEAQQRAQQIAQQYYQNYLIQQQTMQQQQQAFQQQRQQHGTVTCNQIGAYTYCNY